jgi:ribosomal protein L32
MTVPKKRTSMSKKRIRPNIWKKKGGCGESFFFS